MEEFQIVPLSQVTESSTNPRRRFSEQGMQDLTDSVRKHGVLVPLLVRPIGGDLDAASLNAMAIRGTEHKAFEIIAGARRYRAAIAAELREIPVRVKEIGDSEALELQIIENSQREDVHPLEEAMGYQTLLQRPGYDVAAIAGKVGKSESFVYQRLKLTDLIGPAQDAFLEDRITAGHAILIARLQPRDQENAFESCFSHQWGSPVKDTPARSVRDLSRWIQENIHLDLHAAPFKKDDADLVAAAGPCTSCPKRTGFLPQLFPDVAKKDTCTDKNCYEKKVQAHIAQKKSQLEAKGAKVLEVTSDWSHPGKAKPEDLLTASKYHKIEDKKDRCDSVQKAVVVAGYHDRGHVLDVCTDPGCKKHGADIRTDSSGNDTYGAQQKRAEEQKKLKRTKRLRILEAVIGQVKAPLAKEDLAAVAVAFWNDLWSDLKKAIIARRGWEKEKRKGGFGVDYDAIGHTQIAKFSDDEIAGFLLELSVARQIDGLGYGESNDRLKEMSIRYGIDAAAIGREVTAEVISKKKAKAPEGKKAKPETKPLKSETKAAKSGTKRAKVETKPPKTDKKKSSTKKTEQDSPHAWVSPEVAAGAFEEDHECERCSCSENRACEGGCSWDPAYLDEGRYLCTQCSGPGGRVKEEHEGGAARTV